MLPRVGGDKLRYHRLFATKDAHVEAAYLGVVSAAILDARCLLPRTGTRYRNVYNLEPAKAGDAPTLDL